VLKELSPQKTFLLLFNSIIESEKSIFRQYLSIPSHESITLVIEMESVFKVYVNRQINKKLLRNPV